MTSPGMEQPQPSATIMPTEDTYAAPPPTEAAADYFKLNELEASARMLHDKSRWLEEQARELKYEALQTGDPAALREAEEASMLAKEINDTAVRIQREVREAGNGRKPLTLARVQMLSKEISFQTQRFELEKTSINSYSDTHTASSEKIAPTSVISTRTEKPSTPNPVRTTSHSSQVAAVVAAPAATSFSLSSLGTRHTIAPHETTAYSTVEIVSIRLHDMRTRISDTMTQVAHSTPIRRVMEFTETARTNVSTFLDDSWSTTKNAAIAVKEAVIHPVDTYEKAKKYTVAKAKEVVAEVKQVRDKVVAKAEVGLKQATEMGSKAVAKVGAGLTALEEIHEIAVAQTVERIERVAEIKNIIAAEAKATYHAAVKKKDELVTKAEKKLDETVASAKQAVKEAGQKLAGTVPWADKPTAVAVKPAPKDTPSTPTKATKSVPIRMPHNLAEAQKQAAAIAATLSGVLHEQGAAAIDLWNTSPQPLKAIGTIFEQLNPWR